MHTIRWINLDPNNFMFWKIAKFLFRKMCAIKHSTVCLWFWPWAHLLISMGKLQAGPATFSITYSFSDNGLKIYMNERHLVCCQFYGWQRHADLLLFFNSKLEHVWKPRCLYSLGSKKSCSYVAFLVRLCNWLIERSFHQIEPNNKSRIIL